MKTLMKTMNISYEQSKKLFHQAQSIGLGGEVFHNSMEIDLKDLVFELSEIEDRRIMMNMQMNQYAASVRALLREGMEKPT